MVDSWSLRIEPEFAKGIDTWAYLNGDNSEHALKLDRSAWLIAHGKSDACRTDCSLPVCGDGILDGGEVCDDGNEVDGDGCARNCGSLE